MLYSRGLILSINCFYETISNSYNKVFLATTSINDPLNNKKLCHPNGIRVEFKTESNDIVPERFTPTHCLILHISFSFPSKCSRSERYSSETSRKEGLNRCRSETQSKLVLQNSIGSIFKPLRLCMTYNYSENSSVRLFYY